MTTIEETLVNETQEQEAEEVMATVTVDLMSNGRIEIKTSDGDMDARLLEDILKRAYETIHEQKIIQMALQAFKSKLG